LESEPDGVRHRFEISWIAWRQLGIETTHSPPT
jgi:hypothetical protein